MPNEGPTEHQPHGAAHVQAPKDGCDCPGALLPAEGIIANWGLVLAGTYKKGMPISLLCSWVWQIVARPSDGKHLAAQLLHISIMQQLLSCCAPQHGYKPQTASMC